MTSRAVSRVATFLLCIGGASACAQDSSLESFEKSLLTPIQISSFSLDPERLGQLTTDQQGELLLAKSVVSEFFSALEDIDGDPLQFMTADYAQRAVSRLALRKSLVSEETTILQLSLRDFTFSGDNRILQLDLYVTVFSEGSFAVNEVRCTLQKNETWQIAGVTIET